MTDAIRLLKGVMFLFSLDKQPYGSLCVIYELGFLRSIQY